MAAGNGTNREKIIFKSIMAFAIVLCTIALGGLSISGAWSASQKNVFYTGAVAGAELVAFASLTMIVFATTLARKSVGWIIFISSVVVCVMNAERSMKQSFDLAGSPTVLREEARLLDERAGRQDTASIGAQDRQIADQNRLRDEKAALQVERDLMASSRIEEAQRRLCVLSLYPCNLIDGVRAELTLTAMAQRGEAIAAEIAIIDKKLEDPGELLVSSSADDLRVQAENLRNKADKIDGSDIWIRLTLLALELIRSFAAWAFLLEATMVQAAAGRRQSESEAETEAVESETVLADAENIKVKVIHGAGLDQFTNTENIDVDEEGLQGEETEPVEHNASSEDQGIFEGPDEQEETPLNDHQQRSRKGGRATAHKRDAEKVRTKVPVRDLRHEDEEGEILTEEPEVDFIFIDEEELEDA